MGGTVSAPVGAAVTVDEGNGVSRIRIVIVGVDMETAKVTVPVGLTFDPTTEVQLANNTSNPIK